MFRKVLGLGPGPAGVSVPKDRGGERGSTVELNENAQTPPDRHFLKSSSRLSDVLYSFACYLISRPQKFECRFARQKLRALDKNWFLETFKTRASLHSQKKN